MNIYARIQNGEVAEKILPQVAIEDIVQPDESGGLAVVVIAGQIIPLRMLYTPQFIADLVPVPEGLGVAVGDSYANGIFTPSPPRANQVPAQVTMRQARLALLAADKLTAVSTAIAALPSPQMEAAQIEWDYATTVERDSPFLKQIASLIQLDGPALDALFIDAASR